MKGKTVTVKLKYVDYSQQTRSKTIDSFISTKKEFFPIVKELIQQDPPKKAVRLLGISITKLNNENETDQIAVQLDFGF